VNPIVATRFGRSLYKAVIASIVLSCAVPLAETRAQTWTGSVSDLWSDASNWMPNTVPNSSSASVTINTATNNPVLININATIANLAIGSTSAVSLDDNQSLTIAGGGSGGVISNAGTITLNSTGDNTELLLSSTVSLSGGGTVNMSNEIQNLILGNGATLTNVNNTIEGAGQIGAGTSLTLINQGTIDANVSNSLTINTTSTVTNSGTLEATNGGTLALQSTVNNSGTILSTGSGSVVNLSGSTITGGTLTTTSGGAMYSNNSTLSGLTISTGSTVTTSDNNTTTLTGTITNNGTIALNSVGDNTNLVLSGGAAVELTSGGSITMSGQFQNRIYGSGTDTLTVDSGATIQGAGQVGLGGSGTAFTLNNAGTINANLTGATLQIAPYNTVTNTNVMEATNGGILTVAAPVTNTGAIIQAVGSGSLVEFSGAAVTGGTLTASGGGLMSASNNSTLSGLTINVGGVMASSNSTFNNVTIDSGSTIQPQDNSTTTLTGTITNNGTIALNSVGDNTNLVLSGGAAVELTSGSSITMSNFAPNRIYGSGTDTLTVDSGATIQGSGQVGLGSGGNAFTLINHGTIDANQSVALNVNPGNGTTSNGLLEATSGATLNLGGSFTNTGGTILSTGSGSVVNLGLSTITGGTLTTASGGAMYSGNSTLSGLAISAGSTVTTADNSTTTLTGTITNNGTIALNSVGDNTNLVLSGGAAVELTSGSSITMSNFAPNRIYGSGSDTLKVDSGATIQGSGLVGLGSGGNAFALINHGTIDANQSVALNVNPGNGTTSNGLLEATSGATLNLGGSFTNTGGTILSTGSGSVVNLGLSTITGGTLTTTSGGAMYSNNSTLSGLAISAGSTVTTSDNNTTTLTGTITNNGTIALNSAGDNTNVVLSGNVVLGGTGQLVMSDYAQNRIYGATGTEQLTNGANHTIEGSGQLGVGQLSFVNNGLVLANQSVALSLLPNSTGATNNGIFQVNSGSSLIVNGTLTNFTTATTLTGGTYNVYSWTMQLPGNVVTNAATILLDGATGTPNLNNGSGTSALANFTNNAAAGSFTIQNGANFTSPSTASTPFANAGAVNIGANSTFALGGANAYFQSGGTTYLEAATSILHGSVTLNGGLLEGFGTVQGNLSNLGGTVHPGDGPGILSVTGTYSQGSSGTFDVLIGGQNAGSSGYSELVITGTGSLGGTLDVDLLNGFTPYNGETFTILTSAGLNASVFSAYNGLQEGNVTFTVAYTHDDVILDASVASAVPEPSSLVIFGIGIAGLGAYFARRRFMPHGTCIASE
jgi:hypothetical protein